MALVDALAASYHGGFARSIQNYSQILQLFGDAAAQVDGLTRSLADAHRQLALQSRHLHQQVRSACRVRRACPDQCAIARCARSPRLQPRWQPACCCRCHSPRWQPWAQAARRSRRRRSNCCGRCPQHQRCVCGRCSGNRVLRRSALQPRPALHDAAAQALHWPPRLWCWRPRRCCCRCHRLAAPPPHSQLLPLSWDQAPPQRAT